MSYKLCVNIPEQPTLEYNLDDGRYRIGSSPDCELVIDFSEVSNVAAQIDVRGEAVFIRNMNPFPIYVGDYELSSSQQGEWPVGHPVLLTQSVSLDLLDVKSQQNQNKVDEAAKRTRSTMQIAVVVACLALCYFLLTSEEKAVDSTKSLRFSFTDLVEELEAKDSRSHRMILNYIIDARVSDVRWGRDDPRRAISAYQLLLDEPLVREAIEGDGSAEGKIRQFALARVDDLSGLLDRRR